MAQISRLKDAEISNGNLINADDIDAELNQLVSQANTQDTELTNIGTAAYTFSGVKTFSSSPKTNGIDERTAGSGVTIDSVRCKDGMIKVSGTPTEGGEIGYASNVIQFHNGTSVKTLASTDSIGFPKGYLNGLAPVYASAATVTFKSGLKARSSDNTADIELAADVTVTLASVWTFITPGLDAGAEASNTWYYYYLIKRVDTGVTSVIASTVNESVSGSITLPTNYTVKRQLPFCVRNDGSSNILKFAVAEGWPARPRITYQVPMTYVNGGPTWTNGSTNVLSNGTQTAYTGVSMTSYVPPISRMADLHIVYRGTGYCKLRTTGDTNEYGIPVQPGAGTPAWGSVNNFPTNSSQSIDYLTTSAGLDIDVFGFTVTEGF